MTIFQTKSKRRVIPRWRLSAQTAAAPEFRPLKPRQLPAAPNGDIFVREQLEEFAEQPSIGVAAEAVSAAMMVGKPEAALPAARFILDQGENAPALLREIATSIVRPDVELEVATAPHRQTSGEPLECRDQAGIAKLRQLLALNPRSAALWADYARAVATCSSTKKATDKAKRAMQTALALAPNSRWVLRAANRFFLHIDEKEFAHQLIAKHPRTKTDPWLMAAEIASAQLACKPPLMQAKALDLLRSKVVHPAHLSELFTAAGTIVLENGKHKHARRLFESALKHSTENALAQAEWANRELGDGLEVERQVERAHDAHEASCWIKYSEGQIVAALREARLWVDDEPFATRPIAMVCHLAALSDDFGTMLSHARAGIAREPGEVLHRNNFFYALLATGKLFECQEELLTAISFIEHRVHVGQHDLPHALANRGMLRYRLGDLEGGRHDYDQAYAIAKAWGLHPMAAHVAVYHARESALRQAPWAAAILEVARHSAHASRSVIGGGIDGYIRKVGGVLSDPVKRQALLFQEGGAPRPAELARKVEEHRKLAERYVSSSGIPLITRP